MPRYVYATYITWSYSERLDAMPATLLPRFLDPTHLMEQVYMEQSTGFSIVFCRVAGIKRLCNIQIPAVKFKYYNSFNKYYKLLCCCTVERWNDCRQGRPFRF